MIAICRLLDLCDLAPTSIQWFRPGTDTWFSIATSAAAPLLAVVAGIVAFLSYRLSRGGDEAARFQKGAEMLTDPSPTKRMAGASLLGAVGLRRRWVRPVAATLIEYVAEQDAAMKKVYKPFTRPYKTPPQAVDLFTVSEPVAAEVLTMISMLPKRRWRAVRPGRWKPVIKDAYVSGFTYKGDDFRGCTFVRTIFNQTTFEGCNFAGVEIYVVPMAAVVFKDCCLRNARFVVHHNWGDKVADCLAPAELKIEGGFWLGATINGISIERWNELAAKTPARHISNDGVTMYMVAPKATQQNG